MSKPDNPPPPVDRDASDSVTPLGGVGAPVEASTQAAALDADAPALVDSTEVVGVDVETRPIAPNAPRSEANSSPHDDASPVAVEQAQDIDVEVELTLPLSDFAAVDEAPLPSTGPNSDERPASVHLRESELVADWAARAEWFEQQAEGDTDVKRRARTLCVASELWAMAGNLEQARATAALAAKVHAPLAQRQARQLLDPRQDSSAVTAALASETLSAPSADTRAHAAFYAAEIARHHDADTSAALRHWDAGEKQAPGDPRPVLFKLAKQLGPSGKPPSVRWADTESLRPLAEATHTIAAVRGVPYDVDGEARAPAVGAFVEAARALRVADLTRAARALLQVAKWPSFSRSARWLAASLLAQSEATRKQSVELLSKLLSEKDSASIRRVLVARALELGDDVVAGMALAEDVADDEANLAFTATDHVAIGALSGADSTLMLPWLEELASADDLQPLIWAVTSALGLPRELPKLSDASDGNLLNLGEQLGKGVPSAQWLTPAGDGSADGALLQLLRLEDAMKKGDVPYMATALVDGPGTQSEETKHQAHYAAGLLQERVGNIEAADEYYRRALRSKHFGEAAARALLGRLTPERASKLLTTLAAAAKDPEHKSLLLIEAALSAGLGTETAKLCSEALAADPGSLLAAHLGEHCAAADGTTAERHEWIRLQTQTAVAPFEIALMKLREYFCAPGAEYRPPSVRDAWQAWPRDLGLLTLLEAEATPPRLERAQHRERLAAEQKDSVTQTQLWLEAAWLFEASKKPADAARCAEAAAARQPLALLPLTRNAPGHPQAKTVRSRFEEQLATTTNAEDIARLYLHWGHFEQRDGNASTHIELLAKAVRTAPGYLPALAELETQAMAEGDAGQLLMAAVNLSEALPKADAIGHVLLASRLERKENGWAAAYPTLKHAYVGSKTSTYAARQLLNHAAVLGDHEVAYEMTRLLTNRAQEPFDRAILLLRSAELACALEQTNRAIEHLTQAIEIHPRFLPALSLRAQLLCDTEQWALAAGTFEALGRSSNVNIHQVDHWYRAAELWLDRIGDAERGLRALEHACEADPTHANAFRRLQAEYERLGAFKKLEQVLDRRLKVTHDSDEVANIQLMKSKALVATGNSEQARQSLLAVIRVSPQNVQALTDLAELSEKDGDALSAEHALLQLVRLSSDAHVQADVYTRLAQLYQGALNNPKRALRCYQEVLRRRPEDPAAFDAMLSAYVDSGQTARAIELLEAKRADLQDDSQDVGLRLRMADLQARDPAYQNAAEETYAQLLTGWPNNNEVVKASANYYVQTGRRQFVVDWRRRSFSQQKDALAAGNVDASALQTAIDLAAVLGDSAAQELAATVRDLLSGKPHRFDPATGRAMSRHLDDSLAPNEVTSALRILLVQTRGILDQALELNLAPLAPKKVSSERVRTAFEVKARAMGIPVPDLFSTSTEPTLALVTGNPSRVVLGSYWLEEASPGALDFVAWRCLKIDQARVGLFTQLDADRLQTVLLAFLSCFVEVRMAIPNPALYETTRQRVAQRLSKTLDDDLPVLALEVLTQLREAEPDLPDAVCKWVNRSAMLAGGDPKAALIALRTLEHGVRIGDANVDVRSLLKTPQSIDLLTSLLDDGFIKAYHESRSTS